MPPAAALLCSLSLVLARATGAVVAPVPPDARNAPADLVERVQNDARVKAAIARLDATHDRLVADIVTLTEIPAPPFKEQARASAYRQMLADAGLTDVEQDAEGNVMGLRRGTTDGPILAIAAHLDTVFPEGTDVRVRRDGTRLFAPGIGDDTRGLAVLLSIVRALDAAGVTTTRPILFIGNVGEEGPGDLRGMRYLFTQGRYKDRIAEFISMDGAGSGNHVTRAGVGSKRYRVTFSGPGGHSYGSFGLVNPAFAMGTAIAKLSALTVPSSPKTTFNVGVMGGGTSVNSIPASVWMDVDMRSEGVAELARVEETFRGLMREAAADENRVRSTALGSIAVDLKLIGDRPSGSTPDDAPLVRTAVAVIERAGMIPAFGASSTDSNIPMSLGIPAITIESGGGSGRVHSLDEWIDVEKSRSLPAMQNALLLLVARAGLP